MTFQLTAPTNNTALSLTRGRSGDYFCFSVQKTNHLVLNSAHVAATEGGRDMPEEKGSKWEVTLGTLRYFNIRRFAKTPLPVWHGHAPSSPHPDIGGGCRVAVLRNDFFTLRATTSEKYSKTDRIELSPRIPPRITSGYVSFLLVTFCVYEHLAVWMWPERRRE